MLSAFLLSQQSCQHRTCQRIHSQWNPINSQAKCTGNYRLTVQLKGDILREIRAIFNSRFCCGVPLHDSISFERLPVPCCYCLHRKQVCRSNVVTSSCVSYHLDPWWRRAVQEVASPRKSFVVPKKVKFQNLVDINTRLPPLSKIENNNYFQAKIIWKMSENDFLWGNVLFWSFKTTTPFSNWIQLDKSSQYWQQKHR